MGNAFRWHLMILLHFLHQFLHHQHTLLLFAHQLRQQLHSQRPMWRLLKQRLVPQWDHLGQRLYILVRCLRGVMLQAFFSRLKELPRGSLSPRQWLKQSFVAGASRNQSH